MVVKNSIFSPLVCSDRAVLIACEESQVVCKAFRSRGYEAYSCDIVDCSGGHPEWHIKQDVLFLLNGYCLFKTMDGVLHHIHKEWYMIIAFPPCTHLTNSGARHFDRKRINGDQERAIKFFGTILLADCQRIAIENPVGIISGKYISDYFPNLCLTYGFPRKPDQIIQPWQFALSDDENTVKTTCLWLIGLPCLKPLHIEKPEIKYKDWIDKKTGRMKRQSLWYYNTRRLCYGARATVASKTFPGIASAMAEQWG